MLLLKIVALFACTVLVSVILAWVLRFLAAFFGPDEIDHL